MTDAATLPSAREARAACLAARVHAAGTMTTTQVSAAYRATRTGGEFQPEDLERGQAWLHRLGLIRVRGSSLRPTALLAPVAGAELETAAGGLLMRALIMIGPTWLRAAAGGPQLRPELIPEDPDRSLRELFALDARREAMLRAAARAFDERVTTRLRARGEQLVLDECRSQLRSAGHDALADQAQRLGGLAQELGYSVTAGRSDGTSRRMTVKTVRGWRWRRQVFLTRVEADVGLADPDWSLVICDSGEDGTISVSGWITVSALAGLLPADAHALGRWSTAALLLPDGLLQNGLPPI